MREPKLVDSGWHQCDDCGEIWNGRDLLDIEGYSMRIDAGGTIPSGECPDPECGALCYPCKPRSGKKALKEGLGFGFCEQVKPDSTQVHGRFKMDCEETTCPSCDDED